MYKLLIADDEPLVCVGVQSMLDWAALGVEIVGVARNGQQAAEMIEQLQPDIVISDIKMPVKSGLQLAQECNEKYGSIPVFIILTSYEDFEFARKAIQAQAIDYLVKLELDESTLGKAIGSAIAVVNRHRGAHSGSLARGNMQALREKFFIRLFNDLFDGEDIYEVQKKDLGIDLAAQGFIVANCEIVQPGGKAAQDNRLTLSSSAMQLVRETLARYLPSHVIPLDMWHFTIVFCLEEALCTGGYKGLIREALVQTSDLLRSYLGVTLHAALGTVVGDLRNLALSYRQSQRCGHGMTDADPVVFYSGAHGSDMVTDYIAEMLEVRRGIRKAFEELDTGALNETLTRLAELYTAHPDDLLHAMDTTCNVLYMAISLLPDGEGLLEQIFAGSPEGYRTLYRLRDADSIAAWVLQLRDGCNELLRSRHQSNKERVVANVKSYILENLDKRLSLHEVAAVFNFNPNYLSHLFSKYAGEGFVEYTTSVRIAAAKEMLANGEGKVYEIAERLGFESAFYFSKVFKKVEGLSPREYLHRLNAGGADGMAGSAEAPQ